jgi:outer membrane receptor protein involved in Fe transport
MYLFILCILSAISPVPKDSTTVELPEIEIVASPKGYIVPENQAFPVTSLSLRTIENERINEPKDISLITPNLYLPDYGSKMTSSVYLRGIGARMEQPAMGLYVDNVPVLNKNNYDFDFFDVRRMDILRGPQGTLYGRNAIGGVINVQTISPFGYQGTRMAMEYGNANTFRLRLATYQRPGEDWAFSAALNHYQSDGFYTNQYDGNSCDRIVSDGFRFRLQKQLSGRWSLDNAFSMNVVKQDGFAYSFYDEETGTIQPVNHNDPCTYERLGISNGLTFQYQRAFWQFSSTSSWQYTDDEMILDQDFLPKSLFTLTQAQKEQAFTQELIAKSTRSQAWEWLFGAFGFYKNLSMHAPVTFKRDGIDELILSNANKGIHTVFPDADLLIEENEFLIDSRFRLTAFGASLFHQSSIRLNRWKLTGGIRFDFEQTAIRYHNQADLHYRFTMSMPDYKLLNTTMDGKSKQRFYEFMPHFSAMYSLPAGNIYFTLSRGYKTGGFNTQIFSDILQNRLMNNMMSDLGVYFDGSGATYDIDHAIAYKPEYSWNYELGHHLHFLDNRLRTDAALFYIDCSDQQLTVFPPGKSTGRLMSNAGRTRSYGVEWSLNYKYRQWALNGSYGYTNARFRSYDDGNVDYAGNRVPYAPQNTVFLSGEYHLDLPQTWIDRMLFHVDWRGAGKIYWNESNTLSQPFYSLLGASVALEKGNCSFQLWGKNLNNTSYHTFYFKSVGNSFVQRGKPVQIGLSIQITI